MFTCDLDLSDFRKQANLTVERLQFGVRDAAREAAQMGAEDAKLRGRFKNRTGALRAGIVARFLESSENAAMWEFSSLMPYSTIIEKGRREVRPVFALALRFVVNGRVVYSMRSKAVRADPFMAPAGRFAEYILRDRLEHTIDRLQQLWD